MTEHSEPVDEIGYADAITELDDILGQLDDDDIDIDLLSELVERAAHLISVCRGRITTAQNRVADIVGTLETSSD
jgi:exodeoxyribonuclease VII small subunit